MSTKKKKIGLYFGSFNPLHIGHMAIANYMLEFTDLDQLWMVVSPHNPLKEKKSLLPDHHRLQMVHLALEEDFNMKASNMEFNLPQPSFTIDTLAYIQEKYPQKEFVVIMGGDSVQNIHKWKNYKEILKYYSVYVYARPHSKIPEELAHQVQIFHAPQMEISASFIRNAIKEGKNMRYFLPQKVWAYIQEMHFYKK
ncbi:MAG: nicotinic acid mononucleotide adenylyltransferase [Bacteroidetes bacterium 4572_77]|nr:MAG: nicotinic acid mononucleotide adenylyltransferase [Bacteroidetes bacterium 4572_77]